MKNIFDSVETAVAALKNGETIILTDDENRENEGDLVCSAVHGTPGTINFMAKFGRGLICVPLAEERATHLELDMMGTGKDPFHTAFTVSVDAKKGISTGISAYDRARTISTLIDPATLRSDLVVPGHVFPLIARPGGVLQRAGHTEATIDLMKLAGLYPAGVICEIMNEDGSMARLPDLEKFRKKHKLKMCSIAQLIAFRRKKETLIKKEQTINLPTRYGNFKLHLYRSILDNMEHIAIVFGNVENKENVLVRVHSECLTGDVFHSMRCDCGEQLETAMSLISKEGTGIIIYMRQEGRGIGLANKIHAYRLQEDGADTVEANTLLGFKADLREYGLGAQIIVDLKVRSIRLLTNNPQKIVGIQGYGFKIKQIVPLSIPPHEHNKKYLSTKKKKLGHIL